MRCDTRGGLIAVGRDQLKLVGPASSAAPQPRQVPLLRDGDAEGRRRLADGKQEREQPVEPALQVGIGKATHPCSRASAARSRRRRAEPGRPRSPTSPRSTASVIEPSPTPSSQLPASRLPLTKGPVRAGSQARTRCRCRAGSGARGAGGCSRCRGCVALLARARCNRPLARSATIRWVLRSVMPRTLAMSRIRIRGSCAIRSSVLPWLVRNENSGAGRELSMPC